MTHTLVVFYIFGTLVVTAFAVATIMSLIIQKQRQTKARLDRQRKEFEYSQTLLNTRFEVQETTLNMVAQELHDNVAQMLTVGIMQITAAGSHIQDDAGKKLINEAKQTVRSAASDLRLLSHSLASGLVEQRDTEEAIQDELTRIEAFSNITCTLDSDSIHTLQPEQKLLLFRIVQEALQNVVKHAKASRITVSIRYTDETYRLTVTDDGVGFNADDARMHASIGMMNMKDRARMLNGSLTITSVTGKGTTLDLQLPVNL